MFISIIYVQIWIRYVYICIRSAHIYHVRPYLIRYATSSDHIYAHIWWYLNISTDIWVYIWSDTVQYLSVCELIYFHMYNHVYLMYVAYIVSNPIVYDFISDQIWYNILAYLKIYMLIKSYAVSRNKCTPFQINKHTWSYILIHMIIYRSVYIPLHYKKISPPWPCTRTEVYGGLPSPRRGGGGGGGG